MKQKTGVNVITWGINIVTVLFGAFGGFFKAIVPESISGFTVGFAPFVLLVIFLLIAASPVSTKIGRSRSLWFGAAVICAFVGVFSGLKYFQTHQELVHDDPNSESPQFVKGLVLQDWIETEFEEKRLPTPTQLVRLYGAPKDVWTSDSIKEAERILLRWYLLMVLPLLSAVFCVTEGIFGSFRRKFETQNFDLMAEREPDFDFERIVRPDFPLIDIAEWGAQMKRLEGQVCQVSIPTGHRSAQGTGFLIAPDLIMTNLHLVRELVEEKAHSSGVRIRFDYKTLPGGESIGRGRKYALASDWLVDQAPSGPSDSEPGPEELDYAILRLAEAVGEQRLGEAEDSPIRGWVRFPPGEYEIPVRSPLLIIQHPDRSPLKLAMTLRSVTAVTPGKTRVNHLTNTEKGSSGSPCFDFHWTLIAIHQSGGTREGAPNRGIPIDTIRNRIGQRIADPSAIKPEHAAILEKYVLGVNGTDRIGKRSGPDIGGCCQISSSSRML